MTEIVRIIYRVVDRATTKLARIAAGVDTVGKKTITTSDRVGSLGDVLKKQGGVFSGVGGALGSLASKIHDLGPIAETASGMIIAYLGIKAAQAIIGFTKDSIEAFADFEYAMADVAAKLGVTVSEIVELTDLAKDMGVKYGVGAKRAAEGLVSFAAAGFDAEESAIALEEAMKMSIITGASMDQSARLLVQSLAVYGDEAKSATAYVDALVAADLASIASANELGIALGYVGGQAANFGLDVQETLAAVAALTNKVGQAEKAGRYLDALFSDLRSKSDRLGFSIYEASGELRPFADIIGLVAHKMEGMTTETKMAWLTEVGLTRQSSRALLGLAQLGDTAEESRLIFYRFQNQLSETGSATKAVETKTETTRFAMMRWNAAVESLQISIGKGLNPIVVFTIDKLTTLTGWITKLVDGLNSIGIAVGDIAVPALDSLVDHASPLIPLLERLEVIFGKFPDVKMGEFGGGGAGIREFIETTEDEIRGLNEVIEESTLSMVESVNSLINQGLVGDAQDKIKEFVNCSVSKSADMHDQIRDSIYDLTVEMHERYARMVKDAEYLGGEQGAAMLRAAEDLKQGYLDKIGTLEEWQRKTVEGWYGPTVGGVSDVWAGMNGDPYNYPPLTSPPIVTRDITVDVGGINIESVTSDIDIEELREDISQTIVDAILIASPGE